MRHYGRFFLVVSELMLDFREIAKKLGKTKPGEFYSKENIIKFSDLSGYINKAFKHKTDYKNENHFNVCNHHIPLLFDDGFSSKEKYSPQINDYLIEIGCSHDYDLKDKNYILRLPRLVDIVKFIGICYQKLDTLLDEDGLIKLSETYGDKY